jgi:tol-pal system protein YbgF
MKHTLAALLIAVPATLLSTGAMSAAGVVEAQPYTPGQTPTGGQSGNASSNDALVMLLDQFRDMRNQIDSLRGLVEEQAYELRNLQRESLERYTDLDSRMSVITSAAPPANAAPMSAPPVAQSAPAFTQGTTPVSPAPTSPASSASINSPLQASSTPIRTPAIAAPTPTPAPTAPASVASNTLNTQAATLQTTVFSEQQQYQMALDSLLQEEQYQRAVTEFDQYLSLYPDGRFVTNAYYWKGQAYVNLSMLNEAREAFEIIVTQYPDGRKVDDAMYSLGTVYDRLGNAARAQQLLRQVQSRFPNTSAANLADIYLRAMN